MEDGRRRERREKEGEGREEEGEGREKEGGGGKAGEETRRRRAYRMRHVIYHTYIDFTVRAWS